MKRPRGRATKIRKSFCTTPTSRTHWQELKEEGKKEDGAGAPLASLLEFRARTRTLNNWMRRTWVNTGAVGKCMRRILNTHYGINSLQSAALFSLVASGCRVREKRRGGEENKNPARTCEFDRRKCEDGERRETNPRLSLPSFCQ